MNINKQILSYCPHFYKIIDFKPYEEDAITQKLIKIYQQYIFRIDINNKDDVESVKKLDKILNAYIEDYQFRKELQVKIKEVKVRPDAKDILKEVIKSIIKIFNNYEEYTTRVIYVSKWI